jgi:hypothetical protein
MTVQAIEGAKMTSILRSFLVLAGLLIPTHSMAQPSYQPRWADKLRAALVAATRGECPKSLMVPTLEYACRQQASNMSARMAQLGPIRSIIFQGTQTSPAGVVEAYEVRFANGQMLWLVNTDADGKLATLWSPG